MRPFVRKISSVWFVVALPFPRMGSESDRRL